MADHYEKNNSIAYAKAFAFSIRIIKLYKYLVTEKKEHLMAKQLLRCYKYRCECIRGKRGNF